MWYSCRFTNAFHQWFLELSWCSQRHLFLLVCIRNPMILFLWTVFVYSFGLFEKLSRSFKVSFSNWWVPVSSQGEGNCQHGVRKSVRNEAWKCSLDQTGNHQSNTFVSALHSDILISSSYIIYQPDKVLELVPEWQPSCLHRRQTEACYSSIFRKCRHVA